MSGAFPAARPAAMPTLNRFPLLGLWAEEVARRLGYRAGEAQALGHAYAVLYAIRAQGRRKPRGETKPERRPAPKSETLSFAGDELPVVREEGAVRGWVGHQAKQTPASYRADVEGKFPDGYYDRLRACFRRLLTTYRPAELDSRLTYDLYDAWKKACGVGRRVDLDRLLAWCEEHAAGREE